jgi:hypothetical protein
VNPDAPHYDPCGGPLRLTVEDLREIVSALDDADSDLARDFGLRDAVAWVADPFEAGAAYRRAADRFVSHTWTMLALYEPDDCEIIE